MEGSRQRGQVIVLFALMLVAMMGTAALVVDLGQVYLVRRDLQNSADTAALIGASELSTSLSAAQSAAVTQVAANSPAATPTVGLPSTGAYAGNPSALQVDLSQRVPHTFARVLGLDSTIVRASAIAALKAGGGIGPTAITVIGPNDSNGNAPFVMSGTTTGTVIGSVASISLCVNSNSDLSVSNQVYADIQTSGSCSAASVTGYTSQSDPLAVPDPLAGMSIPPQPAGCDPNPNNWTNDIPNYSGSGWDLVSPGCYKNINVSSSTKYRFLKGIYYVSGDVKMQGDVAGVGSGAEDPDESTPWVDQTAPEANHPWGGVTFYLTGNKSNFTITAQARVKLASYCDSSGWCEKVLIWVSNGSQNPGGVSISGGGNTFLKGTIYAPQVYSMKMTGNSAYGSGDPLLEGAIVTRNLELAGGAGIVVKYNSDYTATWPSTAVLVK